MLKSAPNWSKFKKVNYIEEVKKQIADHVKNPLINQQKQAKKNLKSTITERARSQVALENPIIGDRYATQLKKLTKNFDRALEGKMTYKKIKD